MVSGARQCPRTRLGWVHGWAAVVFDQCRGKYSGAVGAVGAGAMSLSLNISGEKVEGVSGARGLVLVSGVRHSYAGSCLCAIVSVGGEVCLFGVRGGSCGEAGAWRCSWNAVGGRWSSLRCRFVNRARRRSRSFCNFMTFGDGGKVRGLGTLPVSVCPCR